MRTVQKNKVTFSNNNFGGYIHSILDFFVLLCWYTCPEHMLTSAILHFHFIFDRYKGQTCFGVLGDYLLSKKLSILSVRRVMRHLVIHTDSCRCQSPGVKSWLLHHSKSPAHTSLLVRNVLPNNTVFTRSGPLRLYPVSKTEEIHERTEICYD